MKTLAQLVKFYRCSNIDEFFSEMSNCLETNIDGSNYLEYLAAFECSYSSWVCSFK